MSGNVAIASDESPDDGGPRDAGPSLDDL
jgi:hypothetical protein